MEEETLKKAWKQQEGRTTTTTTTKTISNELVSTRE
jgi:hypothetical protein